MPSTTNSRGKIVYADVSLNGLTLEIAAKRKADVLPTISKLLERLTLFLPSGERVSVLVELDDLAFQKPIFKQARASLLGAGRYKIEIGVGLITQLSVVARSVAADKNLLRGRTKAKLIRADVRKDGREAALSDFVFHFMLAFIVWHEVAHVALGHLDWLGKKSQLGVIEEFGFEPMPDNEFTWRQTLEADADRQASMWTAAMIDYAASNNPFLRYPSLADLCFDIGYIYGSLFVFLDAIDARVPDDKRKHPKAEIRLAVVLAFVEDYLNRFRPEAARGLQKHVVSGGVAALLHMLHPAKQPFDPLEILKFMSANGKRLDDMGVRHFQHRIVGSDLSSFQVIGS